VFRVQCSLFRNHGALTIDFLSEVINQIRENHEAFLRGYGITIYLTLASMALALLLGLLMSLARTSDSRPLRIVSGTYVEYFRNTPLLVQLYFWFFALPKLPSLEIPLYGQMNWLLSPLEAAILGLTLYTGAYTTEALRSGLQSIDKGQTEASRALGLSYMQTRLFVVAPQAFRVAIPLLTSILSALFRNSALASVVGVYDLLGEADRIQQGNFRTVEVLFAAGLLYLCLTLPLAYASNRLERHVARAR
jgi:His/Glu/Gln/Arg/opine family amino acid ABC transporter permease subunit